MRRPALRGLLDPTADSVELFQSPIFDPDLAGAVCPVLDIDRKSEDIGDRLLQRGCVDILVAFRRLRLFRRRSFRHRFDFTDRHSRFNYAERGSFRV